MSSGFSGSIPPSIMRAGLQASLNDVLVRLVVLPDTLRDNPTPLKIQGSVIAQNPDGTLSLQTDRGVINILLKDRQALPLGQIVDIDIPAGRPPVQAAMRAAPVVPTQPPSLTQTLAATSSSNPNTPAPSAAAVINAGVNLRVDRTNVNPQNLQDALNAVLTKIGESGEISNTSPLQLNQAVRLTPLSISPAPQPPQTPEDMVINLMRFITQLPDSEINLKSDLVRFVLQSGVMAYPKPPSNPAFQNLQLNIQNIAQTLDIPQTIDSDTPTPFPLSTRSMDVRVIGFPTPQVLQPQMTAQPLNMPASFQTISAASLASPQTTNPSSTPTQSPPPSPNTIMVAQVIGFTPKNFPVLQLIAPTSSQGAPQPFVMQFPTTQLPVGAPVFLTPLMDVDIPLQPQTLNTWFSSGVWDTIQDLIHTTQSSHPGVAQSFTQTLPQTAQPQNIGALALLFLSALRANEVDQIMPQQMINLMRQLNKMDALRGLNNDSAMTNRLESTILPQDWRASIFPLWHDNNLHKLPIFWKRWSEDNTQKDRDKRNKLMRFLFDLKLSRMGDVQVDGFLQPQRLDMILRTKHPLSVPMQQTMRLGYVKAMEKSNLTGELSFQFKPEQWVSIDMPLV